MSEPDLPPFVDADDADSSAALRLWRATPDEEFLWRVKALATWSSWPQWGEAGAPPERICESVFRWLSNVIALSRTHQVPLDEARRLWEQFESNGSASHSAPSPPTSSDGSA